MKKEQTPMRGNPVRVGAAATLLLLIGGLKWVFGRRLGTSLTRRPRQQSQPRADEPTPTVDDSLTEFLTERRNEKLLVVLGVLLAAVAAAVSLTNAFLAVSLSLLSLFLSVLVGGELFRKLPRFEPAGGVRDRFRRITHSRLTWFKYGVIAAVFIFSLCALVHYREFSEPSIRYHERIGDIDEVVFLRFMNQTMLAMWIMMLSLVFIYDLLDAVFRVRAWLTRHRRWQVLIVPAFAAAQMTSAFWVADAATPLVDALTPKITGNKQAEEWRRRERMRRQVAVFVIKKERVAEDGREYIGLRVIAQNLTGAEVRGFKGRVIFGDAFEDKLKEVPLKHNAPLGAHERREFSLQASYDSRDDADRRVLETRLNELIVVWSPEKVLLR